MDLKLLLYSLLPVEKKGFENKLRELFPNKKDELMRTFREMVENRLIIEREAKYEISEKGIEDYKKMKKELKKISLADIQLHPAGGIIPEISLWYEPLSENEFVYNWKGKKGLAQIKKAPNGAYYVVFNNKRFWLKGKPLTESEFIFTMPIREEVYNWINGKREVMETEKLVRLVNKTLHVFLDLGEEINYDVLTLSIFHSWLLEMVGATWFVLIYGPWGGGKTTTGEILASLFRHGYVIANPSIAFIGRCLDRMRISPFIDEIDAIDNREDLISLIRQSYRKGAKYSRINKEGMTPDTYYTFAIFAISVHGFTEEALTSRTFPIATIESKDYRLPIINLIKGTILTRIYTELFIWSGENIINIDNIDYFDDIDIISQIDYIPPDGIRKLLFLKLSAIVNHEQGKQLEQYTGRTVELGYLMARVAKLLNMKIDLVKAFKISQETINDIRETGVLGTFRDYLISLYHQYKDNPSFRNRVGEFMVSNKDVFERFNSYLAQSRRQQVTPKSFKSMLLDLGFTQNARKHMLIPLLDSNEPPSSRLTLIFTSRVCRKIGLNYTKMVDEGKELKTQKSLEETINNEPEKEQEGKEGVKIKEKNIDLKKVFE